MISDGCHGYRLLFFRTLCLKLSCKFAGLQQWGVIWYHGEVTPTPRNGLYWKRNFWSFWEMWWDAYANGQNIHSLDCARKSRCESTIAFLKVINILSHVIIFQVRKHPWHYLLNRLLQVVLAHYPIRSTSLLILSFFIYRSPCYGRIIISVYWYSFAV